jgi:hypothetical protein
VENSPKFCDTDSPLPLLVSSVHFNTNYFSWKSHMEDVFINKELYWITLGKEKEPINDDKYSKWDNRND